MPKPTPKDDRPLRGRPLAKSGWILTAADEQAATEGCWVDPAAGRRVVQFIEGFLCHSLGRWRGQPFTLQDWQKDGIVMPLFAWKRADGTRRFRRAYIEIPRKNGKSTLASALGLYLMIGDGEPGAHVFSAAVDREQASIVHGEALRMITASPELTRRIDINRSTRTAFYPATDSLYRALSSEAASQEGLNIHGVVIDELHVWAHGKAFWDVLRYGMISRRQPLMIEITTAGVWDKTTLAWEEHAYAAAILDGDNRDPTVFVYIASAEREQARRHAGTKAHRGRGRRSGTSCLRASVPPCLPGDWTDPAVWQRANPGWGVTVDPQEMAEACAEARAKPRMENTFKRYRLNLWTEQAERWLALEQWDRCVEQAGRDAGPTPERLRARPCWGGLDLSSKSDLTSFALVWPPLAGRDAGPTLAGTEARPTWRVRTWSFAPRETRDAARRELFAVWERNRQIELIDGEIIDYGFVIRRIRALAAEYALQDIGFDPYNATQAACELAAEGIAMVEFRQGFLSMNEPTKELERLVLGKLLDHGGDPVLRWAAGNCAVRTDPAGNIKPDKERSTEKIDPLVAVIMGIGRALAARSTGGGESVYESEGLTVL